MVRDSSPLEHTDLEIGGLLTSGRDQGRRDLLALIVMSLVVVGGVCVLSYLVIHLTHRVDRLTALNSALGQTAENQSDVLKSTHDIAVYDRQFLGLIEALIQAAPATNANGAPLTPQQLMIRQQLAELQAHAPPIPPAGSSPPTSGNTSTTTTTAPRNRGGQGGGRPPPSTTTTTTKPLVTVPPALCKIGVIC